MDRGCLALVLHAHLPFVRHPEHEDSLEERWFYEALTDTYVPLLRVLERLVDDEVEFRLTLSLTPTLTSMFLDPLLQSRYQSRLERLLELSRRELRRTRRQPKLNRLARMYHRRFKDVRNTYLRRYDGNLIQGFKRLQDLGKVEVIASAATHGYLPLLSENATSVRAQIQIGVDSYKDVFGRQPEGFWLPECAYYQGLDRLLRAHGIRYTILDTHGITRGNPRPRSGVYEPVFSPEGLAVFGRDPESSKQVWSSTEGYPGDYDYREFYRDIGFDLDLEYIKPFIHRDGIRLDTGIKYHRITGRGQHKELYIPEWAEQKAEIHAEDFLSKREGQVRSLTGATGGNPVIVAPYDAELFGHWWFEGPIWLDRLIRRIASKSQTVRLVTPSEYLEDHPSLQVSSPSMSSWGDKGFNGVWLNGSNDWIYPQLHKAALRLQDVATRCRRVRGLKRRALNQAARELLLAQASDWAFMINSGTMSSYARRRTEDHISHLHRILSEVEKQQVDEIWLSTLESRDNIFPRIRFDSFARALAP